MISFHMHVLDGADEFHIAFDSTREFGQAYSAFSAICTNMVSGFGDAKSSKLYRVVEEANKTGRATMQFKHQLKLVDITVIKC